MIEHPMNVVGRAAGYLSKCRPSQPAPAIHEPSALHGVGGFVR